jgi:ComF family protein
VGPYEGVLRDLVLRLKFNRQDELAVPLGRRLATAIAAAGWSRPDHVVPVPLPLLRRIRRGFNQSALIAEVVGRELGVPVRHALRRHRRAAQVGRSRSQRLAMRAFTFQARRRVSGRVLLVDDVVTTGATARVCTAALRRAGAASVVVAAVAYTSPPGRLP